jgi:hypothetical protein
MRWPAVLAGVALAVVIALVAALALPPFPAAVASVFGLLISGYLAAKLAFGARVYHGAVVGAGYVMCVAVGLAPPLSSSPDPLSDTVAIIAWDALALASAMLGGSLAKLASSSDTDKGR